MDGRALVRGNASDEQYNRAGHHDFQWLEIILCRYAGVRLDNREWSNYVLSGKSVSHRENTMQYKVKAEPRITAHYVNALFLCAIFCFPLRNAMAADGSLDTTFGSTLGPVNIYPISENDRVAWHKMDIARDRDGNLFVCGTTTNLPGRLDFRHLYVARLNPDGSPDLSFGSNGVATASAPLPASGQPGITVSRSIALQSLAPDDQRILVGGIAICSDIGYYSGFIARLNADGTLDDGGPGDTTLGDQFGTNGTGFVIYDREPAVNESNEDFIFDVAVATNEYIALAGLSERYYFDEGNKYVNEGLAALLTPNGERVKSFGTNGVVYFSSGGANYDKSEEFPSVLFDHDGNLVFGADFSTDSSLPFRVVKMDQSGLLVTNFGVGGIAEIAGATGLVTDVHLNNDDLFVYGGIDQDVGSYGSHLAFCDLDVDTGLANTNFGEMGVVTVEFPTSYSYRQIYAADMAIDASNRLWGTAAIKVGDNSGFACVCVDSNGVPDPTFGDGGVMEDAFDYIGSSSLSSEPGLGLIAEPDGRFVMAVEQAAGDSLFRLQTNGFLDGSLIQVSPPMEDFITESLTKTQDNAVAIHSYTNGLFYVVATCNQSGYNQSDGFVIARYLADGTPDLRFPANPRWDHVDMFGKQWISLCDIFHVDSSFQNVTGMDIDSAGRILLCGSFAGPTGSGKTTLSSVVRLTAGGELDSTFGAGDGDGYDGVTQVNVANVEEATQSAVDVLALPEGGYVTLARGFMENTLYFDTVLFKLDEDGILDESFGVDGRAVFVAGEEIETYPLGLQRDRNGRLLVLSRADGYVAVARFSADGTLDTSFGAGDGDGFDGASMYNSAVPFDFALQRCGSEERCVISGYSRNISPSRNLAMRICSDGTLDAAFGNGGYRYFEEDSIFDRPVVIQPDGKSVVIGCDSPDIVMNRVTLDGRLDVTFGGSGTGTALYSYNNTDVTDVILDEETWRIVAVGKKGNKMAIWGFDNTPVSTLSADFGQALELNGTDSFVTVSATNDICFSGSNSYTVASWVYPQSSGEQYIYRMDGQTGGYRNYLRIQNNGKVLFGMQKEGSSADKLASIEALPLDQWSHVAAVKDGDTMHLYVDGQPQGTTTIKAVTLGAPQSTLDTYLGVRGADMTGYLQGTLDEVTLFNAALTQEQIQSWAYRSVDISHGAYSNAVLHFNFDTPGTTIVSRVNGDLEGALSNLDSTNFVESTVRGWQTWAGNSLNGTLIGNDVLGTSSNGLDWNLEFQIVTNGPLGTVATGTGNSFIFTPSAACPSGTNEFSYRFVNIDGLTSGVATATIVIPEDWDADGMADSWEATGGLSPTNAADVSGNLDGDAFGNYDEYIADTSPNNAADFFQIVEIDGSTVFFDSSDARLYTLLSTTNLVGGQWSEVGSQMGAGGLDSMCNTNDVPQEFYKLEVALP